MSQTPDFILGDEFAKVLTETTMSLVCVLDQDGRILFFNDACERVTGFTRDEVIGGDARDFVIPPEEADAFGEVLAYVWATGLSSPQVGHWLAKDGGRKLIAWSNRLMPSADGGAALLVTAGIDLSASRSSIADEEAFGGDPEARLAEIGRLAQEQRALRRVATLVASEASPERVFTAVSEECARVLEVNASAVFRFEGDDTATIVGRHSRQETGDAFTLGLRLPADEDTGIGQVLRTRAPARIHDYSERSGEIADNMRLMNYRSSVSAPIVVAGIIWGAVGIASAEPLPADTEARLGAFCELVSLAVASAQAREDLSASRARLVKAGDEQRRKLERNLHDGAQQRLVSLALTIRLARRQLESNAEAAAASLGGAAKELDLALQELRELARGLHPAALTEQGLGPALAGVAERLPIDVEMNVPTERLPENIEATAYYIVSEALTNVAKHAKATKAKVDMTLAGDVLKFEITDDGRGGADPSAGSGILGLRDRAEAVGGTLFVISPPGKGTVVTAQIPLSQA
ncbi:MAG TPA: GAF domain-containing protein [Gaiellaceae bacterium]